MDWTHFGYSTLCDHCYWEGTIPAWFLRIGEPVFAAPLAQLLNQSMVEGAVPSQWRTAVITPIPKVPKPTQAVDYRAITITLVLSRSVEKYIVRTFI